MQVAAIAAMAAGPDPFAAAVVAHTDFLDVEAEASDAAPTVHDDYIMLEEVPQVSISMAFLPMEHLPSGSG